ncbi:MAG: hypothetical protein WCR31_06255 [Treponema sp.]
MNRRILKAVGVFVSTVLFLASCSNMSVPQSVSVKTNATYNANFGSFSKNLSEYISTDSLQKQITSANTNTNSGIKVYDYNPGGNETTQNFLIKYPVLNKTIDIASSLAGVDLTSTSTSTSISQNFVIPSINKTFSQDMAFPDLSSQIDKSLSLSPIDVPVYGMGTGNTVSVSSDVIPSVSLKISSPKFSTLTYRSGNLVLTVTASSTDITSLELQATLKNSTGKTISTSGRVTVVNGSKLTLPLADATLVSSMTLSFSGSITGGSPGTTYHYTITPSLSNTKLAEVTGLTMSSEELGSAGILALNNTIDVSNTNPLVNATIGAGSITISCGFPSGWSGVTASTSNLGLSGAISTINSFTSGTAGGYLINESLNLVNASFTPGMLNVTGTVTIALDNATVIFPESGIDLTMSGSCAVSSFSLATIDTSSYTTTYSYTTEVPSALSGFVKSIHYIDAGVKINSYTNGLPAGINSKNDIGITLSSGFLDISSTDGATGTIAENTTNGILSLIKKSEGNIDVSNASNIDITVDITLPGYDSTKKQATLTNISTGTTYSFAVSGLTLTLNWDKLEADSTKLTQEDSYDTGINLTTIMSSLPDAIQTALDTDHITIDSLPLYLSLQIPSSIASLSNLSFSGKIHLTATAADDTTLDTYILGSEESNSSISPDSLSLTTDSSSAVTTNIAECKTSEGNPLVNAELASILNGRPKAIRLYYSITPANGTKSDITIEYKDISSLESSGLTISATVYIVLPLKLTVQKEINIDMLSAANITSTDIFSRTEQFDTSTYEKYVDAIKNIGFNLGLTNNLGINDLKAKITDGKNGTIFAERDISLTGSMVKASMTGTEISNILNTYPFMPVVTLVIPVDKETGKQTISIPRNASVAFTAQAVITTDGTIKLYGGNN